MRVILLTHGGAEMVIEKICALDDVEMAGVFIETATAPQRSFKEKIRRSIRYDGYPQTAKKFLAKILKRKTSGEAEEKTVADARQTTAKTAGEKGIPVFEVENYHSDEAKKMMNEKGADLGIIYGTNIIKKEVFSIPRLGSINLHQGFAPFYRGGPPVFWELFNDEKAVGLTVHFVASKVDTGDIILQKQVPLEYDYSFGTDFESFIAEFQNGLREDCAGLVAEAVELIASGNFPRIPQDTTLGRRYRLPLKKEKDEMRRRLRERMKR